MLYIEGFTFRIVKSLFNHSVEMHLSPTGPQIQESTLTILSSHLQRLHSDLLKAGAGGSTIGDRVCIFERSTGIAVVRSCGRGRASKLVVLEHSQFTIAEYEPDNTVERSMRFHGETEIGQALSGLHSEKFRSGPRVPGERYSRPLEGFGII